jgi:hypothetical protein
MAGGDWADKHTGEIDVDKKLKTKWVAALRSGKYKQGRDQLKTVLEPGKPPQFCCLGVLKEIEPSIRACRGRNYLSCKHPA